MERVEHPSGWFADVPTECAAWVRGCARVDVVPRGTTTPDGVERLEMQGCVLARDDATVVSCGGLLVRVPRRVDADEVTVVFSAAEPPRVA